MDVHKAKVRSFNMSRIRGKDTKPEMIVRKLCHSLGFRFRLHNKKLPGKPDLTFSKHKAIIQVNGCFWHKHECHLFKWPSTRKRFWEGKINRTAALDRENNERLEREGWRVLTVWECALKGKYKLTDSKLRARIADWLTNGISSQEIAGIPQGPEPMSADAFDQAAEPNSEYRLSSKESSSRLGR